MGKSYLQNRVPDNLQGARADYFYTVYYTYVVVFDPFQINTFHISIVDLVSSLQSCNTNKLNVFLELCAVIISISAENLDLNVVEHVHLKCCILRIVDTRMRVGI